MSYSKIQRLVTTLTDEKFSPKEFSNLCRMTPKEMISTVINYEKILKIANKKSVSLNNLLIDWSDYLENEFIYGYRPEEFTITKPSDHELSAWFDYVINSYLKKNGSVKNIFDQISDQELYEINTFFINPTKEVAEKNKYLSSIENAVGIAKKMMAQRSKMIAQEIVDYYQKPLCLKMPLDNIEYSNPKIAGLIKGKLECWIFFCHSYQGIGPNDLDDANLLHFETIFVDNQDDINSTIVASASGMYLIPCKGEYAMNKQSFRDLMDAHSPDLNDAWKVIIGEYIPSLKLNSLREYYDYTHVTMPGMVYIVIEVNPVYKGMHFSKTIFDTIREMTFGPDLFNVMDDREIEEIFDYPINVDNWINDLRAAPATLFVIHIAGSEPEEDDCTIDFLNIYNPKKSPCKVRYIDSAAELKRIKLNDYFNKLNKQSRDYDIVTYNPWDYSGS